jgi:hypothetical protein
MREEDFSEWVRYGMGHRQSRDDERVAGSATPQGQIADFVSDLAIIVAGLFGVVILLRTLVGAIAGFPA